MRILIPELNFALAHIVRQELEMEGYELELCHNAEEAFVLACNRHHDLLMLELELDTCDLISLVNGIRAEKP
jgi:two-component system, OmpR family, response regulator